MISFVAAAGCKGEQRICSFRSGLVPRAKPAQDISQPEQPAILDALVERPAVNGQVPH